MSFQNNLRQYREKLGITAKDFAAQLGINYGTYAGYETQGREPKYNVLCKIAAALNVSIDDLIGHTEHDFEYWQGFLMRLGLIIAPLESGKIAILSREPKDENDTGTVLGSFPPGEFLAMMEKIAPTAERKARDTVRNNVEIAIQQAFHEQIMNDEIQRIAKSIKTKN
ncbi:putative transcriptional regulator [Selenomonas ruminantium subsp. lactilytica TAM6421]|uniref:Putative transcriptional regulator n=1 Tax=Selenomonas ruminantium subsp. lactilytica (strain NBRC 103574 / TAM6421) TaxID=927704 RepID=I0GU16_SELRL|nr:helix-turn-helix transcriptional regulator [Selenomonas ruminantium]BAL84253.1 putative transcriptional regulator [Selenomonas ruminantium subsp. lactilytica TAM6421]